MNNKKYLCFRFDIDTHKCIRDGVPPILKLFKKYNILSTLFLNMGQAIDYVHSFRSIFIKNSSREGVVSLSAFEKLGMSDYLQVLLLNPIIGKWYKKNIHELLESGHEIGLHGGHNHESWHNFAKRWDNLRVGQEIGWGISQLSKYKKNIQLYGFASPGWNGSPIIDSVLPTYGFSYVSDTHTDTPNQTITKKQSLFQIPTNISGEPGGVGYIEHCRAKGMRDREIIEDFTSKLREREKFAVIYDHPYYVGVKEIFILEEMIKIGLSMEFTIVPMKELIHLE